jgi:hypothetical protein
MPTQQRGARPAKACFSPTNATTSGSGKVGRPEIVIHCNDQALTLREWSHQRDIGVEVIRTRLRLGWSAAQALEFEERPKPDSSTTRGRRSALQDASPRPRFGRLHTVQLGARSLTVQEWSDQRGLPVGTVVRRLNLGWSPEEALRSRKRVRQTRMLTCAGRRQPLRHWCQERELPEDRVRSRLRSGWSPEQALGFVAPPGPTSPAHHTPQIKRSGGKLPSIEQALTHHGETNTVREWARSQGIGAGTVQARIRMGWTVAQALGFEERPRGPRLGSDPQPD